MNTIKAIAAGALLLAVFALPTLTATQLVGVLGEKTELKPLSLQLENSNGVFRKLQAGVLTVSYLQAGLFPVMTVTNPNPVARIVRVSLGTAASPNVTTETVTLSVANMSYRLYDHAVTPFNPSYDLIIPPGITRRLDLIVQGSSDSSGTVKMTLTEF